MTHTNRFMVAAIAAGLVRPRIADIAKRADLSEGTVEKALRGDPISAVSIQKLERALAISNEMPAAEPAA